jgi:hypothetical protein
MFCSIFSEMLSANIFLLEQKKYLPMSEKNLAFARAKFILSCNYLPLA